MIEVKTADLSGPALDYAVAQATKAWEWAHEWFPTMTLDPEFKGIEAFEFNGGRKVCRLVPRNPFRQDYEIFTPSTDWSQGGRLLDCFKVGVTGIDREHTIFFANAFFNGVSFDSCANAQGSTPLIAICRAIVRLMLGDVVQVPVELV